MTQEYEAIDWHGAELHINQDETGSLIISHDPFETFLNPDEVKELVQFIRKYRSHPVQSPIPNDEQCRICSQSERDKVLDEAIKEIRKKVSLPIKKFQ